MTLNTNVTDPQAELDQVMRRSAIPHRQSWRLMLRETTT